MSAREGRGVVLYTVARVGLIEKVTLGGDLKADGCVFSSSSAR